MGVKFSQVNFNLCSKGSPFLVSKSAQPLLDEICYVLNLGPQLAKIGKCMGICMKNDQKNRLKSW